MAENLSNRESLAPLAQKLASEAIRSTHRYISLNYRPSSANLAELGLGKHKPPDLLVFPIEASPKIIILLQELGGPDKLAFTPEDRPEMRSLLSEALLAIRCKIPALDLSEEDQQDLGAWQDRTQLPFHLWHLWEELPYGISLNGEYRYELGWGPAPVPSPENLLKAYFKLGEAAIHVFEQTRHRI